MTKQDHQHRPLRSTSTSRHNHIKSSSSIAPSHSSIPFRGSFANLFSLLGLSSTLKRSEGDEDDEDEEDVTDGEVDEDGGEQSAGGGIDEESLMWDAQTALISHHPELAIKIYTQAALPPFCSASACLALGNLLIRGSTLMEHEDHDLHNHSHGQVQHRNGRDLENEREKVQVLASHSTITTRIYSKFFGSSSSSFFSSQANITLRPTPPRRPTLDLVASGWQIPKDGKRAVRDVRSMGIAGAWFVLGLSWLVQEESEREKKQVNKRQQQQIPQSVKIVSTFTSDGTFHNAEHARDNSIGEEEVLSFDLKGKLKHRNEDRLNRQTTSDTITKVDPRVENTLSDSVDTLCPPRLIPSSNSGRTSESTVIRTPGDGLVDDPFELENEDVDIESTARRLEVLQTMYDLLQPLLKLYRHGHIQPQDPVFLPPISLQALPSILRPRNETEKGRNVWKLGHIVAFNIALLDMMKREEMESGAEMKETQRLRGSVDIILNYILGMTSHDLEAEIYFKNVVSHHPTGYEVADDLIRQAAKRLDIITSTPKDENIMMKGFPFPDTHLSPPNNSSSSSSRQKRSPRKPSLTTHGRKPSASSITSLSASRILSTPIKSSASVASLSSITDENYQPVTVRLSERDRDEDEDAMSTLRRVHAKSMADLTEAFAQQEEHEEESARYPSLDGWKLSPPIENDRYTSSLSHPNSSACGISQQSPRTIIPNQHYQGVSPANINTLRPVASSPQFGTLRATTKGDSSSRRKLPFEPSSIPEHQINPIDPELAKAELSSALTKHVICGVCEMQGVNFPECRRCGLTFCSRECRVGEDKAGNGKKHICGLWESRKLSSDPDGTNSLIGNSDTRQSKTLLPVRAARVH
ncbi:hypothetical protein I203_101834 [Kwoniella mangroviensis CBS 8507]|uniref:uncharacterized protein n=1 Tax=Kwoniella mangroviensis CBS 8507 TaxID=1296122 RepID=UPI00080CEFF3|nr:uncharacterized protein I203_03030 [Kwoniella mangroviensis CBS 8507]OCF67336.1 hypothetical protein I203_03030 [Kwoniella mangroviensis CBS 8507]